MITEAVVSVIAENMRSVNVGFRNLTYISIDVLLYLSTLKPQWRHALRACAVQRDEKKRRGERKSGAEMGR